MTSLYIQSEGGGPAWQVWPVQDVIPSGAVREAFSYLFELRDSDDAPAADLLIDDMPVEALRSRQPRLARWRWTPGFHAGSMEAALRLPGKGIRRFEITTDPDLRKLTRNDFDAMVREVLEDTFALFSLSAFRKGIARQPNNRPPPLARLEFLRSRAEEITQTVAEISRSPRHFLRAEQVIVPAHRAVRATGPEIIKSFRGGLIRMETSQPSRLPAALGGRLPTKITVRQRRSSVDIQEHRQIKACLRSWAAWLSGVADVLAKAAPSDDREMLTTAGSWAVRARHIARRLNDATRSGFMPEVTDGPALMQMSSLFRNDPVYHRFYRLWQDMNLGLAGLFGDFLQMPLARTYELYELWCFLRLLRAAIQEYGPDGVDLHSLFTRDAAGGVTVSAGAVVVPIGSDKVLCFQRQYREYWIEPSGEGSFSRTMVPDIVLAGTGLGTLGRHVIILDAKYRINDGLNEALSSIHTYRDALVQEADGGQVKGFVTAAYLLTPHTPVLGTNFRTTSIPGRLFHPQFRGEVSFRRRHPAPRNEQRGPAQQPQNGCCRCDRRDLMVDVLTPEQRRLNMSRIRGRDTKPEMRIRRGLHARGFRYRLQDRKLPGRPDLVFPRYRAVIFVHGCFWHGHNCPLFRLPATRQEFWSTKIASNRARDSRAAAGLLELGWRVANVWECCLRGSSRLSEDEVINRCQAFLLSRESLVDISGSTGANEERQ